MAMFCLTLAFVLLSRVCTDHSGTVPNHENLRRALHHKKTHPTLRDEKSKHGPQLVLTEVNS
jgi:hypothetical protein